MIPTKGIGIANLEMDQRKPPFLCISLEGIYRWYKETCCELEENAYVYIFSFLRNNILLLYWFHDFHVGTYPCLSIDTLTFM